MKLETHAVSRCFKLFAPFHAREPDAREALAVEEQHTLVILHHRQCELHLLPRVVVALHLPRALGHADRIAPRQVMHVPGGIDAPELAAVAVRHVPDVVQHLLQALHRHSTQPAALILPRGAREHVQAVDVVVHLHDATAHLKVLHDGVPESETPAMAMGDSSS